MSIDICHDCGAYCDTDFGEGEYIEVGNMKRLHNEVFVCQSCLEERLEEQEHQDAQAGMAEEEAERSDNG